MMITRRPLTTPELEIMAIVRDQVHARYEPIRQQLKEDVERARHLVGTLTTAAPAPEAAALEVAQQVLQLAENRLTDVEVDEDLDMQEAAFLAGQRNGFLTGVRFAVEALSKGHDLPANFTS